MEKSKVYFIKDITPENIVKIYEKLGIELKGRVGVKFHSGEDGNQNYLRPDFFKPIMEKLNATLLECNTAYNGARNTTKKHLKLMKKHGWSDLYNVDIMDSEGDATLKVNNPLIIKENYVGKHIFNYDSILVLSHFKGHPSAGFGGALKQLSIGFASSKGKAWIHGAGGYKDIWNTDQSPFLNSMADAASTVTDLFKGRIAYINVMKNMSVDCDCCSKAEDPCLKDVGILASLDPLALDTACLDLIKNGNDEGKEHFLERVESRKGEIILDAALKHNIGSNEYELIDVK